MYLNTGMDPGRCGGGEGGGGVLIKSTLNGTSQGTEVLIFNLGHLFHNYAYYHLNGFGNEIGNSLAPPLPRLKSIPVSTLGSHSKW
jgi:hypothetical protein